MVLDTSAIVAIVVDEPERVGFSKAIGRDPRCLVSEASVLECSIVLEARIGSAGADALDLVLQRGEVDRVPVDRDQMEVARAAWRRFGKGNHPASLNMGDCFSYALAVVVGEPLLFKGEDFSRTDVPAVIGH